MRRAALAAGAAGLVCLLSPAGAGAATFAPNTTADEFDLVGSGAGCSLREAIEAASTDGDFGGCSGADEGEDTIILRKGAVYGRALEGVGDNVNATGDLDIRDENLTIVGNGATIRGTGTEPGDKVMHVQAGIDVSIDGVTVRDGFGNTTLPQGGGIINLGTLVITNSAITNNTTTLYGGGIENTGGPADLTLRNVTVSSNFAYNDSGGIDGDSGAIHLINSTVTANTADAEANGAGNGGGFRRFNGTLELRNTIVAGNSDATGDGLAPDCSGGGITSQGHNLIGNTAGCGWVSATGDVVDTTADLGPLADNGGPAFTHALLPSSPALNTGDPAAPGSGGTACEAADQRGVDRTLAGRCDIGAYELVRCGGAVVNGVGTAGRDVLNGTGRRDVMLLLGGNDQANGRGGGDTICGGTGADKLRGAGGQDRLLGQAGPDTLRGGGGRDRLLGGGGADRLFGQGGRDLLKGGPGRDQQRQ